jgi:DNA-directed RNA polymerase specialized sigma24 family protein
MLPDTSASRWSTTSHSKPCSCPSTCAEALDELSAKHREVLELHYRGDLTQQQISERLDVPVGTVKTRTYHALRGLKRKLEERELRD